MFILQLKKYFFIVVIISSILLAYLFYQDYSFSKNPLNENYIKDIQAKHIQLKQLAYKHYKIKREFPVLISDQLGDNKFGITVLDTNRNIKIYLNKKRFKENNKYMIDDVLPHEYAHAIMFEKKHYQKHEDGHSKQWQNICKKLNGLRCDRFVNNKDILMEKTNPF
jgi:predicted SprT family Zn-dependent metalloprotease